MSVEVLCDRERCMYNDEGECARPIIQLDDEGVCQEYEIFRK